MNFQGGGVVLVILTIVFTAIAIKRRKNPSMFITIPFWLLVPATIIWTLFFIVRGFQ